MSTERRNGVQVVHRVAAILMALRGEPGLSLAEIADRVGLPRSTVHRLITALERERFVASGSRRGVRLGPALAAFTRPTTRDLAAAVRPFLANLAGDLNETVSLGVLEHDRVLFVDQVATSTQPLRTVVSVGAVAPAHCTATGKALLSVLPSREVERLLPRELEQRTPRSITSRAALLEELERVRADGVAYNREEHMPGVCAVGTAIDASDESPAAITIPLPAQRFYGAERPLATALLRSRAEINAVRQAA